MFQCNRNTSLFLLGSFIATGLPAFAEGMLANGLRPSQADLFGHRLRQDGEPEARSPPFTIFPIRKEYPRRSGHHRFPTEAANVR